MIGKLGDEVQRRNEEQKNKSTACKAVFFENDKSTDKSIINKDNDANDRRELRRNQTAELRCNQDTRSDKFPELDESKRKNYWYKAMAIDNGKCYDLWASCDPRNEICDGGVNKERVNDDRYMWTALNVEERLAKFSIDEEEEPPIRHCCNPLMIMVDGSTRA